MHELASDLPRRPLMGSRSDGGRRAIALAASLACSAIAAVGAQPASAVDPPQMLAGHVLPALARARVLPSAAGASAKELPASSARPLALTVVLRVDDAAGLERFLAAASDPGSPRYHHYLKPVEIANRFGPSRAAYQRVRSYFVSQGFVIEGESANRLTILVQAPRATVEKALGVVIGDYELDGRRFRANASDPRLPASVARHVQAIIGLNDLARAVRPPAQPQISWMVGDAPSCESVEQFWSDLAYITLLSDGETAFMDWGAFAASWSIQCIIKAVQEHDANAKRPAGAAAKRSPFASPMESLGGTGQTIGLLEYDGYHASDVADFLAYHQQDLGQAARLTEHPLDGGPTITAGESEVLMDIGAVMLAAPGASYAVYDAPPSTSFQALFNAMVVDGVTVISNSWSYCEDQTTAADAQSLDQIFVLAGASGITVVNGSGDTGSTCFDGRPLTVGVPSDAPHAIAVGGATVTLDPGFVVQSASWWHGSADTPPGGDGGFGVSRFFARPPYQSPAFTTATGRSVPDLVAPADPRQNGLSLCQADRGGCPTGFVIGGTSLAAPLLAAEVALWNQRLGSNLGSANTALYTVASSSTFHDAAAMSSDFAHVGLGLPHLDAVALALLDKISGAVSAASSRLSAPDEVYADGTAGKIGVFVRDDSGDAVPGQTVTLTASGGSADIAPPSASSSAGQGAVVFTITDSAIEDVTFTAHVGATDVAQTALVHFVSPRATAGGIAATPASVPADGASTTTITVTLHDEHGNGTPNKLVSIGQGTGGSVIAAASAITNALGVVQLTATDDTAETVTYTATDVTDGLPVPGSAPVTFGNASPPCSNLDSSATASAGYAITTFASGFYHDCNGPIGVSFDNSGRLFVGDFANGQIYAFDSGGGAADPAHLVAALLPANGGLGGIAFTPDGRLYATVYYTGKLIEIDPETGAVLRTVATFAYNPIALAVDPVSGDLFVGSYDYVERVSDFATGPGTVTRYANGGGIDGITFAPDGTLYVKGGTVGIFRLTGTAGDPITPISCLSATDCTHLADVAGGPDGIALQPNPSDASKPFLYVNRNDGTLTKVDLTTDPPTQTDVFTSGGRGDFVTVGPDGCLYATQSARVLKVTKDDGSCDWFASGAAPAIALTPAVVSPDPAQGTTNPISAQLVHVASPEGTPVFFTISGANAGSRMVRADANGTAVLSYIGIHSGDDVVVATASTGALALSSNPARVTWTAGKHATEVNLNLTPEGGSGGRRTFALAGLFDLALGETAVSGASLHFDLAGATCDATTDATGMASCDLVAPNFADTLAVSYAGDATHLPASASVPYTVTGGGLPFDDGLESGLCAWATLSGGDAACY